MSRIVRKDVDRAEQLEIKRLEELTDRNSLVWDEYYPEPKYKSVNFFGVFSSVLVYKTELNNRVIFLIRRTYPLLFFWSQYYISVHKTFERMPGLPVTEHTAEIILTHESCHHLFKSVHKKFVQASQLEQIDKISRLFGGCEFDTDVYRNAAFNSLRRADLTLEQVQAIDWQDPNLIETLANAAVIGKLSK